MHLFRYSSCVLVFVYSVNLSVLQAHIDYIAGRNAVHTSDREICPRADEVHPSKSFGVTDDLVLQ